MIKRIELVNFMSHRHTVIEPAAGLTVLVGPNNCGKSAIVTALQILCHNDNSTYVLRHGASECRILVETDDGHRIEWIRKKNGSPSYRINGKEFDRLKGNSGVWEELRRTLRLPRVEFDNSKFDVHIGEQRNPVFLLGDKGKGAAQFFASSSDAIRLVEMQGLHKKRTSDNRKERSRLAMQKTQVQQALECLEPVSTLSGQIEKTESGYATLKAGQTRAENLRQLLSDLAGKQRDAKRYQALGEALAKTPELPHFADPQPLQDLIDLICEQQTAMQKLSAEQSTLRPLKHPPTFGDSQSLETSTRSIRQQKLAVTRLSAMQQVLAGVNAPPESTDSHQALARTVVQLQTELAECSQLKKQLKASSDKLDSLRTEIEHWVAENPGCPTCGAEITTELIVGKGGHRHG